MLNSLKNSPIGSKLSGIRDKIKEMSSKNIMLLLNKKNEKRIQEINEKIPNFFGSEYSKYSEFVENDLYFNNLIKILDLFPNNIEHAIYINSEIIKITNFDEIYNDFKNKIESNRYIDFINFFEYKEIYNNIPNLINKKTVELIRTIILKFRSHNIKKEFTEKFFDKFLDFLLENQDDLISQKNNSDFLTYLFTKILINIFGISENKIDKSFVNVLFNIIEFYLDNNEIDNYVDTRKLNQENKINKSYIKKSKEKIKIIESDISDEEANLKSFFLEIEEELKLGNFQIIEELIKTKYSIKLYTDTKVHLLQIKEYLEENKTSLFSDLENIKTYISENTKFKLDDFIEKNLTHLKRTKDYNKYNFPKNYQVINNGNKIYIIFESLEELKSTLSNYFENLENLLEKLSFDFSFGGSIIFCTQNYYENDIKNVYNGILGTNFFYNLVFKNKKYIIEKYSNSLSNDIEKIDKNNQFHNDFTNLNNKLAYFLKNAENHIDENIGLIDFLELIKFKELDLDSNTKNILLFGFSKLFRNIEFLKKEKFKYKSDINKLLEEIYNEFANIGEEFNIEFKSTHYILKLKNEFYSKINSNSNSPGCITEMNYSFSPNFETPYSNKVVFINIDTEYTNPSIVKHEEVHILNKYFLNTKSNRIKEIFIGTYQEEILAYLQDGNITIHTLMQTLKQSYNEITPYFKKNTKDKEELKNLIEIYNKKLERYVKIAYLIKEKYPDIWLYKLRLVDIHHWEYLL